MTVHRLAGQKTATGRAKGGLFATGNPGGPGRPRRATEREYLSAISESCTTDDWAAIVQKAVEDARAGDKFAREWLSRFLVGNPEGSAPSLHSIAVQAESGTDPVAEDAHLAKMLGGF